jgi:hypothetical protein
MVGDPRCSSVWPSMRTNTTRILTAFSDFRTRLELMSIPETRMCWH